MNKKIGEFISTQRKKKGLTQKELGEKLFVTDKAISKWERGLSMPDTPLLKELAKVLDCEVSDILNGEIGNKKIDLDSYEKEYKRNKRSKRILLISVVVLVLVIAFLIFKNIYFGYSVQRIGYEEAEKKISLGVPNMSFMSKVNKNNFSFKNFGNTSVLEKEIKDYFKTLKYSNCNGTIYYYNEKDDYSIIDYSVKGHLFYSTISYSLVNYDYCLKSKINDYSDQLHGLYKVHVNDNGVVSRDEKSNERLYVEVVDGHYPFGMYDFSMTMRVYYYKNIQGYLKTNNIEDLKYEILEQSSGSYEIVGDKLYYYRNKIFESSSKIKIPQTSTFEILEDGRLVLLDNYLDDYGKKIVLR